MSSDFLKYDGVLELTNDRRKLLIGNGFSMAYNKNRFSFTSLLQSAIDNKIIKEDSKIRQIFINNATSDFEEVIKILENTSKVIKIYSQNEQLYKQLLEDSKKLKEFLVKAVTNNHPGKITDITDSQFETTINFIQEYEAIYSLNYDLLLYWATEKLREKTEKLREKTGSCFTDGFFRKDNSPLKFDESNQITCFHLHGALHIFDDGDKIIKKARTTSEDKQCLITQIQNELDKNKYPVFISEGSSEQKKTKIIHNAYLNHCYKSLSTISGDLVVFGTMLKSNDEHIQEAILTSKVKTIYFGVSSLKRGQEELADFIEKAKKLKKPKQVKFYDYKSVKIW